MHEERYILRRRDTGKYFRKIASGRLFYTKDRDKAYATYEERARALSRALDKVFGKRFEVVADARA